MRETFGSFVTAWVLIIAGFIIGGAIIIVNVVNGFNNGWTGGTIGWIVGAVLGMFIWEAIVGVTVAARIFKKVLL